MSATPRGTRLGNEASAGPGRQGAVSPGSIYLSEAGERAVMKMYDEYLGHWPVGHRDSFVDTRCGRTFVIDSGAVDSPALVLIHGANSNALSWGGDVAAYAARFRVLCVDLPGQPGRSDPYRPSQQGEEFSEWLQDVLDGLGIQTAALVGLSKGGLVAAKFAAAHPERVTKLVLVAPAGLVPARASFLVKAIGLSLLGKRARRRINLIVMGDDPMHPTAVHFMEVIMDNVRSEMGGQFIFSNGQLQNLTMPSFIFIGEKDAIFDSKRMVARAASVMPQCTCIALPARGHALVGLSGRILPLLLEP